MVSGEIYVHNEIMSSPSFPLKEIAGLASAMYALKEMDEPNICAHTNPEN